MQTRPETRRQRYALKAKNAVKLPVRVACVNLIHEENVAFIIRAAACFGAEGVDIIGGLPPENVLKAKSGSMNHLIPIRQFGSVEAFLEASLGRYLVSLELTEGADSIEDYSFDFGYPITLITGHEEIGIPAPIIYNSDALIYIPMRGQGFCLNTSQALNIALYECAKQFSLERTSEAS